MNDLISRQGAIDAFKKELTVGESKGNYVTLCSAIGYEEARQILESLPSAQPERKKGRWIRNDNGTYSCSICQSWIPEEQRCYARYCLYCGADMRGGRK